MEEEKDKKLEFTLYDERQVPYQKIPLCIYMSELFDSQEKEPEKE